MSDFSSEPPSPLGSVSEEPAARRLNPRIRPRPPSSSPPLSPVYHGGSPPLRLLATPPRNRARIQPGPAQVINLAEDVSDEDDVVFVGQSVPMAQPRRLRADRRGILRNPVENAVINGRPIPPIAGMVADRNEFARTLADIDRRLAEAAERHRILANAEREEPDERRRAILSPPAQPPPVPGLRPRIGFGGAVLRAGQNLVNLTTRTRPAARVPVLTPPRMPAMQRRVPAAQVLPNHFLGIELPYDDLARGGPFDPGLQYARLVNALAGPARGGVPPEFFDNLPTPAFPTPPEPFTSNFEITTVDDKAIEIDSRGRVVHTPRKKRKISPKPYLACANCTEPLRVSGAYRNTGDRVWALRCGHIIDGRCLDKISAPSTVEELAGVQRYPPGGLDVLGGEGAVGKNGRPKRTPKKKVPVVKKPDEYAWVCPVKGCGLPHRSIKGEEGWEQKEMEGALSMYM